VRCLQGKRGLNRVLATHLKGVQIMNDKSRFESNAVSDLQISGAVQSLSDWAEIDVPQNMQVVRSIRAGSPYGDRLMDLQSARRFLTAQIEAEERTGMPTAELEVELAAHGRARGGVGRQAGRGKTVSCVP
jgi:hypothetical protein